jgi:hypothetical protein
MARLGGQNTVNIITLQERRVEAAQKQLDRLQKMQDDAIREMQRELARLEQLRRNDEQYTDEGPVETIPNLSSSTLDTFRPQYEQYNTVTSNKRLVPTNHGIIPSEGKIEPEIKTEPFIGGDGRTHWDEIDKPPYGGEPVYVSGYYYSSGPSTKRYEYLVWPGAYPIKVGDMVQAPVHPVGYHQGKPTAPGHDRRYIIEDIYSNEQFKPYHDIIR